MPGFEDCLVDVISVVAVSFVPAAISAPSSGWVTRGVIENDDVGGIISLAGGPK